MSTEQNFMANGRVGEVVEGIGGEGPIRLGRTREVIVTQLHGQFHEAAYSGRIYTAITTSVSPASALVSIPPLSLYNPLNSGLMGSILQVWMGYDNGTLPVGAMYHGYILQGACLPAGGTELTPVPGMLSGLRGSLRAYAAGGYVAVPTLVRPGIALSAHSSAVSVAMNFPLDEVQGAILVPPGTAWAYNGIGIGGTSPVVRIGVVYEEVPIPQ